MKVGDVITRVNTDKWVIFEIDEVGRVQLIPFRDVASAAGTNKIVESTCPVRQFVQITELESWSICEDEAPFVFKECLVHKILLRSLS